MTGGVKPNIKSAAGQCKLRVVETETRDAIVTDVPAAAVGQPHNARTIAYVAIGAESWGTLLAAAPDLRAALHDLYEEINSRFCSDTDMTPELLRAIIASRAALAKATL